VCNSVTFMHLVTAAVLSNYTWKLLLHFAVDTEYLCTAFNYCKEESDHYYHFGHLEAMNTFRGMWGHF